MLLFAGILLILSANAQQLTISSDTSMKFTNLQDVFVTSNRMEIQLKKIPQKLEIISKKDIEMNPTLDIGEIIKKMAAIDVIQRPGVATYASIRGFRPPVEPGTINPETSVLINGRPSGTQNLALIDPSGVERIEILKGAAAAIYGSSAMGGIINIITKHNKGEIKGNVFAGYGSFKTNEFGFSLGGNISTKVDFNLSSTFLNRNDDFKFGKGNIFRKMLGSESVELFPLRGPDSGKVVTEMDTAFDGRKRSNTKMAHSSHNIRLGYQISKNWRVEASGAFFIGRGIESSGDLRNLDAQQGKANRYYQTYDLSLKGTIKNHNISALVYNMKEENSTFNNWNGTTVIAPVPTYQRSENIVTWNGLQVQDVLALSSNTKITFGFDYNKANSQARGFAQGTAAQNFIVTERSPTTPFSTIETYAAFAQAHFTTLKGKLIINPSIRYDFMNFAIVETPLFLNLTTRQAQNKFFSPSLAMQYNITNDFAVHTNVGRAFRFAQATQLAVYFEEYFAGNRVRILEGNPNLKNEQSATVDFGVKYNNVKKGIDFDVTYFSTVVQDRIRQIFPTARVGQIHTDGRTIDRYSTYDNADEAKIQGLEINAGYDFGALNNYKYGLRVFTNITHIIEAVDKINGKGLIPNSEARIRNVAPFNMGFGVDYDTKKAISLRLSGRYMSKRYAQDFSNTNINLRGAFMEFPRYITLDFTANYTISKQNILSLRISNLSDENYYESRGFNLAGRSVGLRYTYKF